VLAEGALAPRRLDIFARMAAYYVLGIAFVLFAVALTALGVLSDGFPPTQRGGRVLMAIAGVFSVATFAVLLMTTEREHPREEAKAEAAEKKAEEKPAPGEAKQPPATVAVVENEYTIRLTGGNTLKPGKLTFDVSNDGKIQHDLAVEDGQEKKTPLIDSGKSAKLDVDLEPGKYKLYCSVPGHEQLGMKQEVTVG
jgi:plastocyanin